MDLCGSVSAGLFLRVRRKASGWPNRGALSLSHKTQRYVRRVEYRA